MNLSSLTDEILLQKTICLAQKEREVTLEILHHLREVERRSLYAKLSYSSLFEYVVHKLKYSEGSAQRRISSMRLLKEIPELETKIEMGVITLSALAQAQTFFRQEKETIKTPAAKVEVLHSLENKSLREVQKELLSRSSNPQNFVAEKLRPISETHSELKVLIEESLLNEIEELRGLIAHSKPNATMKELIAYAVGRALKELRPKAPKEPCDETKIKAENKSQNKNSRYIPQEVRRKVWQRDHGQCNFAHPLTGRRCNSKHGLEYDHIQPFALGGKATVENLRLRCRTHNQLAATISFGKKTMSKFIPRMK